MLERMYINKIFLNLMLVNNNYFWVNSLPKWKHNGQHREKSHTISNNQSIIHLRRYYYETPNFINSGNRAGYRHNGNRLCPG
jgi:hypothetical protein